MHSAGKKLVADLLFIAQLIFTFVFGGSQFLRMLKTSQGVSITWFLFWEVFLVLNLVLTIRAHYRQPSRVTLQTVLSYVAWTTVVTADLGVMLWRRTGLWTSSDTGTSIVAGAGILGTLIVAYRKRLPVYDPIVRGYLALFFKAIPQLTLAYNIYKMGGAGIAGLAVVTGHITICTRLGQLWFAIREAGWERNRIGSAISEVANEGSWIVATAVWLTR